MDLGLIDMYLPKLCFHNGDTDKLMCNKAFLILSVKHRLFTIYMRKPFGSRFGQLVSKFRIVIFLSGLVFTICTNPSHLQRESGTGIKDEV